MPLTIEYRALDALIPYARNSRTHSDEQVAQIAGSIKEFGFTNPLLIAEDGGIVAGHGRLLAAQRLKLEQVPCIVLDGLTESQRRALVIADNRIAGFLNDGVESTEGLTDEDATPDVSAQAVTVPGDVWLLGKHRVMCGSSVSIEEVERLTNGVLVDMWLTDPPYNVAYEGATKEKLTIQNDSMSDGDFRQFLRDAYVAADAVMKPGAVFYIWHADSEGYNFRGAAQDAGWKVRQCLIWKKSQLVMGRQDYHWKHEPCLYGWKEGAGHLWAADRKQTTILEFDKPQRNGEHPTMKPVALFEYQLLNNTKGGDIVLDSFGGSGTTIIAAEKNGRIGYAMELDPKYCDVIVKRWQEFAGKTAILEGDGRTFDELSAERTA